MSWATYPSLADRPVFVSGGASGIGREIVSQFAAQRSQVATVDLVDDPELPDGVWYRKCDVRDTAGFQETIRRASEDLGPIRVLVNNVARDDRFDNATMTEAEWDDMLAVNLRHAFFAAQAVRAGMAAAGGGSIVNFMSPSVDWKEARLVAYATAKAGLYGMTRTLAGDFGLDRIRVNAVQPGWVFTARQRERWVGPGTGDMLLQAQALKELATERDVARLVLFLAADDARMMTAQVVVVDGGWT